VVELEDDEDKEEMWGREVEGYQKLVQDFRFESCREVYVLEKPIWRLETPSVVPWLQGETKQGEIESSNLQGIACHMHVESTSAFEHHEAAFIQQVLQSINPFQYNPLWFELQQVLETAMNSLV